MLKQRWYILLEGVDQKWYVILYVRAISNFLSISLRYSCSTPSAPIAWDEVEAEADEEVKAEEERLQAIDALCSALDK